jgi:hypothetical protein
VAAVARGAFGYPLNDEPPGLTGRRRDSHFRAPKRTATAGWSRPGHLRHELRLPRQACRSCRFRDAALGAGMGLGTALMPRVGVKPVLSAAFFGAAAGLLLTSGIGPGASYAGGILPGMLVLGMSAGLSFPAILNAALHQVTGQDSSLASGVQSAMQQAGGALGLACLVALAVRHAAAQVRHVVAGSSHPPGGHRGEISTSDVVGDAGVALDGDEAGRDRVHGDTGRGELAGPGEGQADLRVFGAGKG